MEKYYSRDFAICLGLALESADLKQTNTGSVEFETEECLHKAGWVEG